MVDLFAPMPRRMLPDGRVLDVYPLVTGTARLMLSESADVQWSLDTW